MNDLNRRLSEDMSKLGLIAFTMASFTILGFLLYIFFAKDNSIEETRLHEFSGIVIEKYIIENEHGSPVIKIKSKNKEDTIIYLNHFHSDVFYNLKIGDTVSTKSGESIVHIHRCDTNFIVFKTEFPAP